MPASAYFTALCTFYEQGGDLRPHRYDHRPLHQRSSEDEAADGPIHPGVGAGHEGPDQQHRRRCACQDPGQTSSDHEDHGAGSRSSHRGRLDAAGLAVGERQRLSAKLDAQSADELVARRA